MKKMALLLFALLLATGLAARAEKARVVTRQVEPFAFEKDGRLTGFSIELWQELARRTGLEYDMQTVGTPGQMIDALKNNQADVAISALSITSEREAAIDFTQPFYESG